MNQKKKSLQVQFLERYGEPGITAGNIHSALENLGILDYSSETILKNAKKLGLAVNLREEEFENLKKNSSGVKYLIKKSDLENLVDGMKLLVSISQLERELPY